MSYQTTIPAGKVSEIELIALVEQIQIITKSQVHVEQQFVITTENMNISSMLDSQVDSLPDSSNGRHAFKKAKKNGKTSATTKGTMTSHSIQIIGTGEIMSTQAFNKKVAAGEIAEHTEIVNSRGESFVVLGGALVKGPQS